MQLLTLYRFYDESFVEKSHFAWLFFLCHWLAVSRSFVNPLIYGCNNLRFRRGFAYFIFGHFLSLTPKEYEAEVEAISMRVTKYSLIRNERHLMVN